MSRENRTHHERMWMNMKWRTQLETWANAVHYAMWRCSDRQQTMHLRFRVCVLGVENSLGGHVVIGVGRVIVQRHHADITNYWILTFILLIQLCTCSQTVRCDRQFFSVAIYCTLLHRENGSFEVLCLQFPPGLILPLEVKITDDFVQCWSNPRIEYFEIGHLNISCWWRWL